MCISHAPFAHGSVDVFHFEIGQSIRVVLVNLAMDIRVCILHSAGFVLNHTLVEGFAGTNSMSISRTMSSVMPTPYFSRYTFQRLNWASS